MASKDYSNSGWFELIAQIWKFFVFFFFEFWKCEFKHFRFFSSEMISNFTGIQAQYATLGMFLVPEIVICLKFKTISLKCPNEPRKKKHLTFHCTGCFIGILSLCFNHPHINNWVVYHPLYPKQLGALFSLLKCMWFFLAFKGQVWTSNIWELPD